MGLIKKSKHIRPTYFTARVQAADGYHERHVDRNDHVRRVAEKNYGDEEVFLAIKEVLDLYGVLSSSWRNGSYGDFCTWMGVTCDQNTKREVALNLTGVSL